jgi:transcriptional regulator with XRE-family HTH domain
MPSAEKPAFERSRELKSLFEQLFEKWQKTERLTLDDLAGRCGVSPAYLSHVRRYGRIPSKPILILLALNFRIDGEQLFRAAGLREDFPYEPSAEISLKKDEDPGFVSLRVDMDGFTNAIRGIVRTEMRGRGVKELLEKRPLRIGLNYHQFWLYETRLPPSNKQYEGFFPQFCRMLGIALQREVRIEYVPFARRLEKMRDGEIDLFGPMMVAPNLPGEIMFTHPLYRLGVSALFRKKEVDSLERLQPPRSVQELREKPYEIALLRNSFLHLLANTLLKRDDSSLILCDSDDETVERVLLKGVVRPAHLALINSVSANYCAKEHESDLQFLFSKKGSLLDYSDTAIAVRPDWPEIVPVLNEAIRFVLTRGGMAERLKETIPASARDLVEL